MRAAGVGQPRAAAAIGPRRAGVRPGQALTRAHQHEMLVREQEVGGAALLRGSSASRP